MGRSHGTTSSAAATGKRGEEKGEGAVWPQPRKLGEHPRREATGAARVFASQVSTATTLEDAAAAVVSAAAAATEV